MLLASSRWATWARCNWLLPMLRKPASVARAVAGADMVVNLVGSFGDMDAIQHIGAGNVARAAKKAKCGALLHISAIGADADSAALYGRSKAAGEAAVRKAFKGAHDIAALDCLWP